MFSRLLFLLLFFFSVPAVSQESPPGKIAVLLDTSFRMGILVPQARKELRHLNKSLEAAGRPPLVVREFSGAHIGRAGGISLAASRNAVFAIQEFFEEDKVDGVYWISALSGRQSGSGFHLLEEILKTPGSGATGNRQLIIKNLWQEQVQAGADWVDGLDDPEEDPLHTQNFPGEWFSAVRSGKGYVIRSWRLPPEEYRDQFGFPFQFRHRSILRKLNLSAPATMDSSWRNELFSRYGLKFMHDDERWVDRLSGQEFVSGHTLIPFLNDEEREIRDEAVSREMSARPTIEEDLEGIAGEKIGVLFGIGYLHRDVERLKSMKNRTIRDWRMKYMENLTRIVAETRREAERGRNDPRFVYAPEMVSLSHSHVRSAEPDRYARRMAELVRNENVDAIYFFTNGYTGGGEYGTFEVSTRLITAAIREANVRLYVRVPFEFGAVPMDLQKLAIASGGGVFLGSPEDEDWLISVPKGEWPPE